MYFFKIRITEKDCNFRRNVIYMELKQYIFTEYFWRPRSVGFTGFFYIDFKGL